MACIQMIINVSMAMAVLETVVFGVVYIINNKKGEVL
jgi:type IV secretory pathway VirB3-like protein